ncbi:BTAD domain-containing putative transcriptional regulator [Actinocorallia sp. A-T 12471]|uniref:BTAD domain-containing putative transcriptional regulator n=1 Tax=Actinocorallia sp. A-T 12471 TaxID=3089813 RepID=UPI0029CD0265|nr:BTAD domain-containing putative transcriptional regulator [Actinocorallia sp. A-T 12471]MDX6739395.1 BTAD domain-containing putative transcriptional regulator [Actinocorallia sp. A-T 12471]
MRGASSASPGAEHSDARIIMPKTDTPAPALSFRLLGPLEVLRDGVPVDLGGPRQRALLALLLVRPSAYASAGELADELWSGAPPAGAVATLRSYISVLRRELEPGPPYRVLVSRAGGYALDKPESDALAFTGLVEAAESALAAERHAEAATGFAEALALWRGPALAGLPDLEPLRLEADRLAELRVRAEEGMLTAQVGLGRHAEAVPGLRRFAAAHPLRETAHRQLILALYRVGNQAEALAAYETLRRTLDAELGIDPSAELRALHRRILQQDPSLAAPEPSDAAAREERPFIGRAGELATLWEFAASGEGVRVVTGPGGIGKTALAERVAARARERGVPVVWGRGPDAGDAPPFWLWAQVAGALSDALADPALRAEMDDSADLRAKLGEAGERLLAPEEPVGRFRLYEGVTRLLARVAAPRGLLVVLDDLHSADADSVLLLRYLAKARAKGLRCLVLSRRPVPLDAPPIELRGLTPEQVAELTGDAEGAPLLHTVTGGNPFHLAQIGSVPAETALHAVIARRLDEHPPDACELVELLAVAGRPVEPATLAAAWGSDVVSALTALGPAFASGLVTERGASLRLAHALLGEAVLAGLPVVRRAALHAALAAAHLAEGSGTPAELAFHYEQAAPLGYRAERVTWLGRAAEAASRAFADAEAADFLRRQAAVHAARSALDPAEAARELDALARRASLLSGLDGYNAPEVGENNARMRQVLDLVDPDAPGVAAALGQLWEHANTSAEYAAAEEYARRLTVLDPVAGAYATGCTAVLRGDLHRAKERLEEAVAGDLSGPPGSFRSRAAVMARSFLGLALATRGETARARAVEAETERFALATGDPYDRASAAHFRAWTAFTELDRERTGQAAARALELCADGGFAQLEGLAGSLLAWSRADDAAGFALLRERAGYSYASLSMRATSTVMHAEMGEALLRLGDPAAALAEVDRGLAFADATGEDYVRADLLHLRGAALAALGDVDAARSVLEEAAALARRQGAVLFAARAAATLAAL